MCQFFYVCFIIINFNSAKIVKYIIRIRATQNIVKKFGYVPCPCTDHVPIRKQPKKYCKIRFIIEKLNCS